MAGGAVGAEGRADFSHEVQLGWPEQSVYTYTHQDDCTLDVFPAKTPVHILYIHKYGGVRQP